MTGINRRQLIQTSGATLTAAALAGPQHAWSRQVDSATPQSASELRDRLDRFTSEALGRYDVPGAAVAVVQDGETVLAKGYGVRSLLDDAPVDADTVFQLASNTKPIIAFTLGTLVDQGLIGWDTPIVDVLPELVLWDPYASRHVTPRDVFAHRSGLPAFTGDTLGHLGYDRAELLHRLRYVEPTHSFREIAAYSNLGYFIAGEVIARLTGAPWEDAVRARLFQPLGMSRSGPTSIDPPADGNVSANHGVVDGELQVVPLDDHGIHGAAGSAVSTANDLTLWMQMLLDGGRAGGEQLISPETVREMFNPSMVSDISFTETPPIDKTSGFSYGMGWGNFHYHGYEVIEKGGALAGVRTVVVMVPSINAGIAVVANRNLTFLPEAIRAFALEQWLGASDFDMQADIESRAALVDEMFAPQPAPTDSLPATVPLENLAGTYANTLVGQANVLVDGDDLRLELGPAGWPATLHHLSRETFLLDWGTVTTVPGPMTFFIGPDGLATAFETEEFGWFTRVNE
ncbi:MAG TPA: serine hydrolase [Thermomicrobiales bacterium]|nr:serine hydrolase [Thermomicrobiales bacterium]